jgi:hypothetical protein
MKRVLLIGLEPSTVDYSDPALPPGMTAEKIRVGIKLTLAGIAERGWLAETCLIKPRRDGRPNRGTPTRGSPLRLCGCRRGLRLPPNRLTLFEAVVDAIHRAAPQSPIAFNNRPEDSGAAAARCLGVVAQHCALSIRRGSNS